MALQKEAEFVGLRAQKIAIGNFRLYNCSFWPWNPLDLPWAMVWNKGKNIEGTIVMGHNLFCPPLQHNGS